MPVREAVSRQACRVSIHRYAGVLGVVLAALGLGGVLGLWHVRPGGIILYLVTAAFFFGVGLWEPAREECRFAVGGLGALYVLSGLLLALAYELPVVPADYYDRDQAIVRLTIGVLSVLAAYSLPERAPSRSSSSSTEEEGPDDPDQERQQDEEHG